MSEMTPGHNDECCIASHYATDKSSGDNGEARMVAIYLGRQLGGHKHEEIGKTVGLGKASSVGLFADEGASGDGEAASAKSAAD